MQIEIPTPCDFHVHLRNGAMLKYVAKFTDRDFGVALLMPNTEPPLDTPIRLSVYMQEVNAALKRCRPLFTFKLTANTKPEDIQFYKVIGAAAAKLYPDGVTTNSESGLDRNVFSQRPGRGALKDVFGALAAADMVLCLHGEMPGEDDYQAEGKFIPWVEQILQDFPTLRVILEHISTREATELVELNGRYDWRLGATVTLHHLLCSSETAANDSLLHCKPVIKDGGHREAIVNLVRAGHPNVFFGSDSAPHPRKSKINLPPGQRPKAGVFSAPVALPGVVQFLEDHNILRRAGDFLTYNGCRFYKIEAPAGIVALAYGQSRVPALEVEEYLPVGFLQGSSLNWSVIRDQGVS